MDVFKDWMIFTPMTYPAILLGIALISTFIFGSKNEEAWRTRVILCLFAIGIILINISVKL